MFGGAEYEVGTDSDCMMDCNRAREEMCAVIVVSVAVERKNYCKAESCDEVLT